MLLLKISAALEATGIPEAVQKTFLRYYYRVATEEQSSKAQQIFQSVINTSFTNRKVNVEELFFTR